LTFGHCHDCSKFFELSLHWSPQLSKSTSQPSKTLNSPLQLVKKLRKQELDQIVNLKELFKLEWRLHEQKLKCKLHTLYHKFSSSPLLTLEQTIILHRIIIMECMIM
jgi:hypothetical protein